MKTLVTGSNGFISGYLVQDLLNNGHEVIGLDNFSKYGKTEKSYASHPNFTEIEGDVKNVDLLKELIQDCDHFVAAAAMIGGISYFHEFAYDLIAENDRIAASSFDAAIWAFLNKRLKKITVMSSSMVFESSTKFPTPEGAELSSPPPLSTYGFQKLSLEFFAKGAFQQYGLPYTIVRPFNCIGIGEKRALNDADIKSGNIKLALSHVVPDLVQKVLKGQDPLRILGKGEQIRHYTYGGDLAEGIRLCIENPKAINEDFNISTDKSTSVKELAEVIWKKIHPNKPLEIVSDPAYEHDVQKRVPDVSKAKKILGFSANTSLEDALDEIIPWIREQIKLGGI